MAAVSLSESLTMYCYVDTSIIDDTDKVHEENDPTKPEVVLTVLENPTWLITLVMDVQTTPEKLLGRQMPSRLSHSIIGTADKGVFASNSFGQGPEFIQSLLSVGKKRLASQFNFTYRYIDDVLSINNPDFENYLGQMYPPELEIKDTTESNTSASYLDLLLSIGRDGQLRTSLYDKRDDFNFHITNFPFLSSNIPSSPAYGVFISQLIRYARACSSYECFILRAMRLSNKLLGQGYVKERLKSSLRKFYGRYGDLTKQYEVPLSRMLHDILDDDHIQ